MKYRKRPLEVEAVQWLGDLEEMQAFTGIMQNMDGDANTPRFLPASAIDVDGERIWSEPHAHLWVEANLTWVPLPVGQWVLKDSAGFYPCKRDIFAQTYEPVSEPSDSGSDRV